jgi:ubiquinone/menaquinone biosynthesis C-methylase UbiE
MEADEYRRLAQEESALWWFGLLHRSLFAALDCLVLPQSGLKCADFGCGTGGFVAKLRKRFPTWSVVGLDKSEAALQLARQHHGPYFVLGDAQSPPFKAELFDVVFAADVLYHRGVEPARMLQAIFAVLKPGGVVILNNPAYEWLRSYHDTFVHTARRYTSGRIASDLSDAGFTVVRCTYWNTVLFPLMVLKRKILTGAASRSDVGEVQRWLNRLFSLLSLPEPALIQYGVNLPFGGSVLAVGRKEL